MTTCREIAPYQPGEFYRRELPCLLAVLACGPVAEVIVVDGYVWLGPERAGLENVNSRAGGAMVHKSVSTWVGNTLRTTWKIERDGRVGISGVDERELRAPDTLVVTTTTEDSKSRSRSVIVYHRGK